MADKYLSLEEALKTLGIEEEQFELLIANGEIKAFRTQGKVKFKDGDVQELYDRLDSINLDSVIDDDELPDISESSEMLPAVELEELEDSDFTIELPDDVASGDPTQSSSSFALEDEDSLMVDVDDLDLDDDSVESPSDITIDADELDLDLDDEEDDLVTSDITIQEDAVNTSELTIDDDSVNTSELTVQEDAVNTSELTVQEDAVNTSELTVNDDFGTEAGLAVDEDEVEEDDDEDDEEYEETRRSSRRGSGRRSSRQTAYESSRVPILWTVFLIIIVLVQVWTVLSYYVPYYYYKAYEYRVDLDPDAEFKKSHIPNFLKGQVEWANKNFKPQEPKYGNSFPTVSGEDSYEIFSESVEGTGDTPDEDETAPEEDE